MSDAYERERQNNSRLSELSAKVTALRGVTVDIYNHAESQDLIDDTVSASRTFQSNFDLRTDILVVKYIFIHEHKSERLRGKTGTHGCEWE